MVNKIKNIAEIEKITKELHNRNIKIVTTNGCFDLLHYGHINFLKAASWLGDNLIVLINSNSSVRKIKGIGRPINNQKTRAKTISALPYVDYVVIFSENEPSRLLEIIKPSIHVKGNDRKMNEIIERKTVIKNGGVVKLIKIEKGFSTTGIINKIKKGLKNE